MLESLLAVSTRFPGLVVGLDSRLGSDKASVVPALTHGLQNSSSTGSFTCSSCRPYLAVRWLLYPGFLQSWSGPLLI